MNYIIFNNSIDAESLNSRIKNLCESTWTDGITNNYTQVKKHPTQELYAVIIDSRYTQYFTQDELNSGIELTDDWFPQINP